MNGHPVLFQGQNVCLFVCLGSVLFVSDTWTRHSLFKTWLFHSLQRWRASKWWPFRVSDSPKTRSEEWNTCQVSTTQRKKKEFFFWVLLYMLTLLYIFSSLVRVGQLGRLEHRNVFWIGFSPGVGGHWVVSIGCSRGWCAHGRQKGQHLEELFSTNKS